MIKLFSLKQQKKDGSESNDKTGSHKKASAAQLRIQKGQNIRIVFFSFHSCHVHCFLSYRLVEVGMPIGSSSTSLKSRSTFKFFMLEVCRLFGNIQDTRSFILRRLHITNNISYKSYFPTAANRQLSTENNGKTSLMLDEGQHALDKEFCTEPVTFTDFQLHCIRPKEKNVWFLVTCPKYLGSVGRQTFFIKTFL